MERIDASSVCVPIEVGRALAVFGPTKAGKSRWCAAWLRAHGRRAVTLWREDAAAVLTDKDVALPLLLATAQASGAVIVVEQAEAVFDNTCATRAHCDALLTACRNARVPLLFLVTESASDGWTPSMVLLARTPDRVRALRMSSAQPSSSEAAQDVFTRAKAFLGAGALPRDARTREHWCCDRVERMYVARYARAIEDAEQRARCADALAFADTMRGDLHYRLHLPDEYAPLVGVVLPACAVARANRGARRAVNVSGPMDGVEPIYVAPHARVSRADARARLDDARCDLHLTPLGGTRNAKFYPAGGGDAPLVALRGGASVLRAPAAQQPTTAPRAAAPRAAAPHAAAAAQPVQQPARTLADVLSTTATRKRSASAAAAVAAKPPRQRKQLKTVAGQRMLDSWLALSAPRSSAPQ